MPSSHMRFTSATTPSYQRARGFAGLRPAGRRQDLAPRRESPPYLALGGFVVDDDEQSDV